MGHRSIDQTHIANLVVSWRFLLTTSRRSTPLQLGSPIRETNRRLPGFFQVDARLDIPSVADNYQIDFVDFINLTFAGAVEDGEAVKFIYPPSERMGPFDRSLSAVRMLGRTG